MSLKNNRTSHACHIPGLVTSLCPVFFKPKQNKYLPELIDRSISTKDVWVQRGIESTDGIANFLGMSRREFENITSQADAALVDTASENWRKASKAEKDYTHEYTHHYCDVNEPLQGRRYCNHQSKSRFIEKVNNITSYIEKNELPVDMWFTRGDDGLSVIRSRIEFAGGKMPSDLQDLVGMVMQEGGFMSTGSRKGKGFSNRSVILNIYAPKGTKAAYIEPISVFGNGTGRDWDGVQRFNSFSAEHETLFQRGTQMRITKVYEENGKIYIDCEVVGQEIKDLSYVKDSDIGY